MLTKEDIKALLKEELAPIKKQLDSQGKILESHGKILESHGNQLDTQGKKLDNLTSEVSHIKTAIKPLATKEDVAAEVDSSKTEILSAILALNAKVTTKVHKHDKSINALHEGTGVPDPNTH
jgi:hypothetical protein